MKDIERTLRFLENELEQSERDFENRGESYNPYYHLGRLTGLLQVAIKAIKEEIVINAAKELGK